MSKKRNAYKVYAIVSTFVFEVLVIIGAFVVAGYFLDKWLQITLFLIILPVLGVFVGIYNLIRKVNGVDKDGTE